MEPKDFRLDSSPPTRKTTFINKGQGLFTPQAAKKPKSKEDE